MPAPGRAQLVNPETGLPTGHLEERTVPAKTQAPPVRTVAWQNKRTGQTERVPEGIDPGWNTNPGKVRQQSLELMLAQKLNEVARPVLAAAIADLAASGRFASWVDDVIARGQAAGQIQIVGAIDDQTQRFLAARGVELSGAVIDINDIGVLHVLRDAKTRRGAPLGMDDLKRLPEHLLTAERYWDSRDPALLYVFDIEETGGKHGEAVVRVNYRFKGKITNRVVTTGVVQPENLADQRYVRIWP